MSSYSVKDQLPYPLKNLPLNSPWLANFMVTLRQISALDRQKPIPGSGLSLQDENFRLSQAVSLAFPASEISSLAWRDNQLAIKLFSLGVWGPQGPLPLHFSELALTRGQQQDSALVDFIDLFHHRSMSIFFRAWYAAQDTASLDRPEDDRFSYYINCVSGLPLTHTSYPSLTPHDLLSASFHLARKNCAPQDLISILNALFQLPFQIDEYQPGWITLNHEEQSRLEDNSSPALLGEGAILGDASYQASHKFKVWCGPLTYEQYLTLHPDRQRLAQITETIQRLTGGNYHFDIQLTLAASPLSSSTLSGNQQLGFDSWLSNDEADTTQLGMVYTSRLSVEH